MDSFRKLLTLVVICIMTLNAFGVAQVTHMCKMASTQVAESDCEDDACNSHDCCPVSSKDCCTDIVKYYRQTVNTTLNPFFKFNPEPVLLTLLFSFIPEPEAFIEPGITSADYQIKSKPGRYILTETHSFLI